MACGKQSTSCPEAQAGIKTFNEDASGRFGWRSKTISRTETFHATHPMGHDFHVLPRQRHQLRDRANLAIAAPSIRAELGLDAVGMGLVLSAFFWTYAFLQLPAGWFIDKVGVRVSLALAVGWWSIFTIATGAARGLAQLVGVRLMLGVGEAAAIPSFAKVAFNWFPRGERGLASSIFDSGSRVGSALSLPLVAWLISVVGCVDRS